MTHLVTPWVDDGHPDHAVCGAVGARLSRGIRGLSHWQYPIWAWHWADPDELPWPQLRRVELSSTAQAAKRRALDAHRSQHSPLSGEPGDEAILPPQVQQHFTRPFEAFVSPDGRIRRPTGVPALPTSTNSTNGRPIRGAWPTASTSSASGRCLLASLPRERFRSAFEPGCATGTLTAALAQRCDSVLAWDGSSIALEAARATLPQRPG